jgi:hypothetical protein
METIRFSPISTQDIRFGTGSFEIILADGRTVTVDEVDIAAQLEKIGVKVYASTGVLPTSNISAGSLAYVTGSGLYQYSGSAWSAVGSVHNHSAADITSGTLAVARGGNGADFSAAAQGVILYFSALGVLSALTPGTSGQFLKTLGAAANPAWATVQASGTVGSLGQNSVVASNTTMTLDAAAVRLRNSDSEIVVRYNPGSLTNTVTTAGPAAGGRDQAGAFSAGSWIHFYWIWDGSTLSSVSSATAPPTGPTLPTNYTHWAYAGAVRFNGSSQLVPTRITGNTAYYNAKQNLVTDGTSTSESSNSLADTMPPVALAVLANVNARVAVGTAGGRRDSELKLMHTTGSTYASIKLSLILNSSSCSAGGMFQLPNTSNVLIYDWDVDADASTPEVDIDIMGYILPNGG